jgi:hypothetical protein
MTNFIIKLLIVLIIIIITIFVYIPLFKKSELHHEGLENKGIQNTSSAIMSQPLRNLCILASSDSVMIDNKASTGNIETLIRKGVRWLDFDINDKDGVPYASEKIRLDSALQKCRVSKNLSPNPDMPIFINIRVTSSGSESFYNNIHKFIVETFNKDELYNSPGKVKTLLSDTKENVMNIISNFTRDTGKTVNKLNVNKLNVNKLNVNKLKQEPFKNTSYTLGTENELYENLTPLALAYRSNIPRTTEGMENIDDDIFEDIRKQQTVVDQLKKSMSDVKKNINDSNDESGRIRLGLKYESIKKQLTKEEEKLRVMNNDSNKEEDEVLKKIKQDANAINDEAIKENEDLETIKNQRTEPVIGAIPSVQREIDKIRNEESMLRLQNVTLQGDISKLQKSNASYNKSIKSIDSNMNEMSAGVEKGLTKTLQCERCVTGDTLLGELKNKVIIVLTRSQFINDAYNNNKLSMPGSAVNIQINDYNNDVNTGDNFYKVLYESDNNAEKMPANLMKITNVPHTTSNVKNMIINNIQRRRVQVLQVPDLENKPEYINMFKHYNSAFIPMTNALKYISEKIQ